MVASGASWGLLGLPMEVFNKAVEEEFGRKGAAIVEKNIEAVDAARISFLSKLAVRWTNSSLDRADGKQKLFMIGNEAMALAPSQPAAD